MIFLAQGVGCCVNYEKAFLLSHKDNANSIQEPTTVRSLQKVGCKKVLFCAVNCVENIPQHVIASVISSAKVATTAMQMYELCVYGRRILL